MYIFFITITILKKKKKEKEANKMIIIETGREMNLSDFPVSNLHTQTFNIPGGETITDCVLYKANTIIKEETTFERGKQHRFNQFLSSPDRPVNAALLYRPMNKSSVLGYRSPNRATF